MVAFNKNFIGGEGILKAPPHPPPIHPPELMYAYSPSTLYLSFKLIRWVWKSKIMLALTLSVFKSYPNEFENRFIFVFTFLPTTAKLPHRQWFSSEADRRDQWLDGVKTTLVFGWSSSSTFPFGTSDSCHQTISLTWSPGMPDDSNQDLTPLGTNHRRLGNLEKKNFICLILWFFLS
jgi:hypothetical protein